MHHFGPGRSEMGQNPKLPHCNSNGPFTSDNEHYVADLPALYEIAGPRSPPPIRQTRGIADRPLVVAPIPAYCRVPRDLSKNILRGADDRCAASGMRGSPRDDFVPRTGCNDCREMGLISRQ